jgi:hypothetical protein
MNTSRDPETEFAARVRDAEIRRELVETRPRGAVTEPIRPSDIRRGDLLRVVRRGIPGRVEIRAERVEEDFLGLVVSDGEREVKVYREYLQRVLVEADTDPFGPYEYVEAGDRCHGAEGECGNRACTQRDSTCRCMCPACCGDTPEVWGGPVH